VVEKIIAGSPSDIWAATKELGTTQASFEKYFAGRTLAYAYQVAAAVKYAQPLDRSAISRLEPGFRVPQNFLYLDNLPHLHAALKDAALDESIATIRGTVALRPFIPSSLRRFRQAVAKHIGDSYLETGPAYADSLVEIAQAGVDVEGFLTERKLIYEITVDGSQAGFVVFTLKRGGAVKTGPLILGEMYRHRGIGGVLRQEFHSAFLKCGYRKVFATVPANNAPALLYLLTAGYRIEAHLARQYHPDHDELVLGHMLTDTIGPGPEFIRPIMPCDEFSEVTKSGADVCGFLKEEFSAVFCPVSDTWAEKQISVALGSQSKFKPRRIFVGRGMGLVLLAVCLIKRGGSVKVILLSRTGHQPSIGGFLEFVKRKLTASRGVRRIYTIVPANDVNVIESFRAFGCMPEGILGRPYNANSDMLVMGQLCDTES
jgi:hypothetical protein